MKDSHYRPFTTAQPARIGWSPIVAGALMSFVLMTCLSLLGIGAGIVGVQAASSGQAAIGAGAGTAIWLPISGLVAFYLGGWITGRMMPGTRDLESIVHGLLSWTFATMAFLLLCAVAAGAGAFGGLEQSASTSARDVRPAAMSGAHRTPTPGPQTAGVICLLGFFCFGIEGVGAALGAYAGARGLKLPVTLGLGRPSHPSVR